MRLYGFAPPCLSIGRLQPLSDVDDAACARDGVDVVRRPSGGRAELHDREVTYAVICRAGDPDLGGDVLQSCARIHAAVAAGLKNLGLRVQPRLAPSDVRGDARAVSASADCFARPAVHELLDAHGRKLVGSAQARRRGALLQHGSVPLDPPRASAYLSAGGDPQPDTGIRALLGRSVDADEVRDALIDGFAGLLGARLRVPVDTTA